MLKPGRALKSLVLTWGRISLAKYGHKLSVTGETGCNEAVSKFLSDSVLPLKIRRIYAARKLIDFLKHPRKIQVLYFVTVI